MDASAGAASIAIVSNLRLVGPCIAAAKLFCQLFTVSPVSPCTVGIGSDVSICAVVFVAMRVLVGWYCRDAGICAVVLVVM